MKIVTVFSIVLLFAIPGTALPMFRGALSRMTQSVGLSRRSVAAVAFAMCGVATASGAHVVSDKQNSSIVEKGGDGSKQSAPGVSKVTIHQKAMIVPDRYSGRNALSTNCKVFLSDSSVFNEQAVLHGVCHALQHTWLPSWLQKPYESVINHSEGELYIKAHEDHLTTRFILNSGQQEDSYAQIKIRSVPHETSFENEYSEPCAWYLLYKGTDVCTSFAQIIDPVVTDDGDAVELEAIIIENDNEEQRIHLKYPTAQKCERDFIQAHSNKASQLRAFVDPWGGKERREMFAAHMEKCTKTPLIREIPAKAVVVEE